MIERRSISLQGQDAQLTARIPFNSLSEDLMGFREKIHPDAFKRTLSDQSAEVLALWNHDSGKPLARRSNGTLQLAADATGLTARITPDDTTWSEDAKRSIAGGTVSGSSFGFQTKEDRWDRISGHWQRTLLDVDLIEISPTPAPAYTASTATVG